MKFAFQVYETKVSRDKTTRRIPKFAVLVHAEPFDDRFGQLKYRLGEFQEYQSLEEIALMVASEGNDVLLFDGEVDLDAFVRHGIFVDTKTGLELKKIDF